MPWKNWLSPLLAIPRCRIREILTTPRGVPAQAEEYIRSVNAGASICHLHGPYTVDEKIQADGTKLSDLYLPGWLELTTLIKAKVQPVIQFGIANGRFPQRVELMKQRPDMMSICFNAHDECFQPDPNYPPVELYGLHDRDELEKVLSLHEAVWHQAGSGILPLRRGLERQPDDPERHSGYPRLDHLLPGMGREAAGLRPPSRRFSTCTITSPKTSITASA